jgi:hypothetical protein
VVSNHNQEESMFAVGDTVRVIRTGQTAKIIGKGSLALPRSDNTAWTIALDGGSSVTVLPEEIEPVEKPKIVTDTWERTVGQATVTYSTEGIPGRAFNHNCDITHGTQTTRVTTIQTSAQLTRAEIEKRFASAEGVAEFIERAATGKLGL